MKKILIHFKTGGYCSMELEVPEDYKVTSTHPGEFWKDLQEKLGDKNVPDIWNGRAFYGIELCEFEGFNIDNMVTDYLQEVHIQEVDGKTSEIILEHIPIHK